MSDTAIKSHLQATRQLIKAAVEQMKAVEPETYQAIALATAHGSAFRVTTCLSVAGLCEAHVDLIAPDGKQFDIARVEFDSPTAH